MCMYWNNSFSNSRIFNFVSDSALFFYFLIIAGKCKSKR